MVYHSTCAESENMDNIQQVKAYTPNKFYKCMGVCYYYLRTKVMLNHYVITELSLLFPILYVIQHPATACCYYCRSHYNYYYFYYY